MTTKNKLGIIIFAFSCLVVLALIGINADFGIVLTALGFLTLVCLFFCAVALLLDEP